MLRFWFGATLQFSIDVTPANFRISHGENYAVAEDMRGNPHLVRFSSVSFPTRSVVTLASSQLATEDSYGSSLRDQLEWAVKNGIQLPVFESESKKAYKLAALEFEPPLPASWEYAADTADIAFAIHAFVTANGTFTDFDALGSATWEDRS